MKILTKTELRFHYEDTLNRIKKGAIFIKPTDTIYGLGCNALNEKAVNRIRELKERPDNPFSIIAPSIKWIEENCHLDKDAKSWLKELPGPYTLILKLKKNILAKSVNPGKETIGVRMPNHWISKIAADLNVPLVTTSANKAGQPFMTSLEDLDQEIESKVDFIIDEGEKKARPSKIINLVTGKTKER